MDASISLETLLLHADADPTDGAIAPPIYHSTPFAAATADDFDAMTSQPRHERYYRRYGHPTQARLEGVLAAAEGAEACLATASGMGAASTIVLGLLASGDHVVAQRSMYGGTLSLLQHLAPRLGIEATLVDQVDTTAFERAARPNTKLFMLETPSNPLLQVTDISAVSALARDLGALTCIDNTVATPVNQRPVEHGVDLVMHSVTKALSGHADVLAGAILGRGELIDRIWETHIIVGSVIGPYDAWLALRGLRTLVMRVERQNRTATAVAGFLAGHPAVRAVNYPGLATHPQHDLARKQMSGYGCLLSFDLVGGATAAEKAIASLRLAVRAPSLGGFRSVVVRPAAMWTQEMTADQLAAAGIAPGLVRLAVGLEAETDLISDLAQALEACQN
jgi:cystathionine beta-lyase/cystathionine gamma-synthase